MYNSNAKFYFASAESLVIFLPGYKRNNNGLPFSRRFIVDEKGFSFLYLPYQLIKSGKEQPIEKITRRLMRQINAFSAYHKFKRRYLIGHSLGAALALVVAAKDSDKFSGLVLISIFDDRKKLLADKGERITEKNNIRPIRLIKKVKNIPTLFVHGVYDKSIDIERAKKVFEESNKKLSKFSPILSDHYFKSSYSKSLLDKQINKFLKRP